MGVNVDEMKMVTEYLFAVSELNRGKIKSERAPGASLIDSFFAHLKNDATAKLAGISILKTRVRKKQRALNGKRSLENEGDESQRSTEWCTVEVSQKRCTAPIN